MTLINSFKYWLFESYRRKILDKNLFESLKYFKGNVIDIGAGRERGMFHKLRNSKWTIIDIDKTLMPDIVAPVEKLPVKNNSVDTIKATDLFGYVEDYQQGFRECLRVLKRGGIIILSFPYLTAFDNEQHDSQRLTEYKIRKSLEATGFSIIKLEYMGYFFTVWAEFTRDFIHRTFLPIRYVSYILVYPILDLLVFWESNFYQKPFWKRYTTGFFIVAKKIK